MIIRNRLEAQEDLFILQHIADEVETKMEFREIFTDRLVLQMINFMRGAGHHDDCIYNAMAQAAKEYFECKEKSVVPLPLQQEDLS
jgi:hypothetical protein